MSKKAKVSLEPGDAYAVLTVDQWEHIISTYRTLAERLESSEDMQMWKDFADLLENWVLYSAYLNDEVEDEWA